MALVLALGHHLQLQHLAPLAEQLVEGLVQIPVGVPQDPYHEGDESQPNGGADNQHEPKQKLPHRGSPSPDLACQVDSLLPLDPEIPVAVQA